MALLGGFKLNKAIDTLLMADQKGIVEVKEALVKIKDVGESAIPKLIEALVDDVNNSYINKLLFELLTNETLPEYIDALADEDKNVVKGVMKVLASSSAYDPNLLFDLFNDQDIPKNVLIQILLARRDKLNGNNLFGLMPRVDAQSQKAILHVIDEIVSEKMLPQLAKYADNDDVNIRYQVTTALSTWEPRIEVLEVKVEQDREETAKLLIRVDYRVLSTNSYANIVYPFYLTERGGK